MSSRELRSITIVLIFLLTTVLAWGFLGKTLNPPKLLFYYRKTEKLPMPEIGRRILVIAPHPDDESLGTGEVISEALANGDTVKVVFMTNGDGYRLGIRKLTGHYYLKKADYISYGEIRQREALAAAKELGIDQKNLLFVGFPDKGLAPIWESHWKVNAPYVSRQTGRSAVPYRLAVTPGEPYTAPALLNTLEKIVSVYRPTDIFVTDTYDCHPDHWASGAFALAAIGSLETNDPNYKPQIFSYVIHHTQTDLAPEYFLDLGDKWYKSPVPTAYLTMKRKAISAYETQILVRPSLLKIFGQPEEAFRLHTIKQVLHDRSGSAGGIVEWPEAAQIASYMPDPDTKLKQEYKGALKSAYILRGGDAIFLHLNTKKRILPTTFIVKLDLLSTQPNDPVYRVALKIRPGHKQVDWVDKPPNYNPALANVTYGKDMIDIYLPKLLSRNEKYLMVNVDTYSGHKILDRVPWSLLQLGGS